MSHILPEVMRGERQKNTATLAAVVFAIPELLKRR